MIVTEPAPAKLNLALHIRARRADGYHELETVFAFATDGDVVMVARAVGPSFTLDGPFAPMLTGEGDNLVLRAVRSFATRFGGGESYAITLDKRLPVASGIGGGSADAAATLRALARLNGIAADNPGLYACAQALGSDVPACLLGRTALGCGRGERLQAIDGPSGIPVLLVNPGVAVSTATVFARWDGQDRGPLDPDDLSSSRNDLESPARALAPAIGDTLALLAAQPGAGFVRMSGSGATCFALFADIAARDAASAAVGRVQPGWWRLASTLA